MTNLTISPGGRRQTIVGVSIILHTIDHDLDVPDQLVLSNADIASILRINRWARVIANVYDVDVQDLLLAAAAQLDELERRKKPKHRRGRTKT